MQRGALASPIADAIPPIVPSIPVAETLPHRLPGARVAELARVLDRVAAERERARSPAAFLDVKPQQALGAGERLQLGSLPHHLGAASQLQEVSAVEIGERQSGAR